MNFQEAIDAGFKNFTNFKGRASRSEHNYFVLFSFLVQVVLEMIDPSLSFLAWCLFIIPNISVMVRRFHDINKSGWNYFWNFTCIGVFLVIYWNFFKAGDSGENFYGQDPLKRI